ncbi:alpha/beta hydrolase [Allokutzneria sp. A3M-2-11 16]|uniref:alpha/beta hydrolase n=1 Tax=Allokutzneria sp. A3M-2-11 16 TaxID=2962043 RepID=UPI0020B64942|nr:alpha/beta hydrolase [Allokutzneria sp. A3M-2-11 16]MCP3799475.1 alpha/beta hydrolase [Allokutzneria sp. A3M-2-11 16]
MIGGRYRAFAVVGLAVSALLSGVAPAQANSLSWKDCAGNADLKCASLEVPMDHADPNGPRVALALVKAPARKPAERLGSLVVNRGGPGFSTIQYLELIKAKQLAAPWDDRVWDRYDVIALDQRGVGKAVPAVKCFATPEAAAAFGAGVPTIPVSPSEVMKRAAKDAEFAAECREHTGKLLDHLSTAVVARDLDLVRAALGELRLNFLGQSYGVALGTVYANLFPARVGSFVLDSVLNPASTTKGPIGSVPSERIGSDTSTRDTMREFLRLCAQGKACQFAKHGPRAYDELLAKLRAKPLALTTPEGKKVSLTYSKLVVYVGGRLYQTNAWSTIDYMLDLTHRALAGEAGADLAQVVSYLDEYEPDNPYNELTPAYSAFTCNDDDTSKFALAWWAAAERRERIAPHFATLRAYETSQCASWQAKPKERYTGPWTAKTEKPALIINNRFDPATPLAGAVELSRTLNSRLLISEGWGHITAQQSTCAIAATSDYLTTGALPKPGTTCKPNAVPFS